MSTVLAYLRILAFGLLAFVAGALTIDWLGSGWFGTMWAVLTAVTVMASQIEWGADDASPRS